MFSVLAAFHEEKFRFSARSFSVARVWATNSLRSFLACSIEPALSALSLEHDVNTLVPQIQRVAASTQFKIFFIV